MSFDLDDDSVLTLIFAAILLAAFMRAGSTHHSTPLTELDASETMRVIEPDTATSEIIGLRVLYGQDEPWQDCYWRDSIHTGSE